MVFGVNSNVSESFRPIGSGSDELPINTRLDFRITIILFSTIILHFRVVYTDSVYPSLHRVADVSRLPLSLKREFDYLMFL